MELRTLQDAHAKQTRLPQHPREQRAEGSDEERLDEYRHGDVVDPKQGRPLKGRWHYLRQNCTCDGGYEEKEDGQAEEHVESADAREGPNGATGTWEYNEEPSTVHEGKGDRGTVEEH